MPDVLVESEHFPYLPVSVNFRSQNFEIEALLDTGFDGYLVMPEGAFDNDAPPDFHMILQVADGRKLGSPVYQGQITLGDSAPFDALVTTLGDEPILGLRAIRHFTVILDHGLRVSVEP